MPSAFNLPSFGTFVVVVALFQGATAKTSSGNCRPDRFPTLQFPGFCAKTSELRSLCSEREASPSTADCGHIEGNFCCYFSWTQGNTVLDDDQFNSVVKEISQVEPEPERKPQSSQTPMAVVQERRTTTEAPTTPQSPRMNSATTVDPNPRCGDVDDCPDAGMTCFRGQCQCWSVQGFSAAQTWSCSDDRKCQALFPGHVCRSSRLCRNLSDSVGFCQPERAIKE
ncbi:hypothetical protein BV898_09541 [Hypsibius exemplaris]|uniref:EB domain-containing protein n=1 Tax=Hypsibius exemplaris TaxID=2072580 RepID=A0A1W0WMH1_HYPEX|nr:hypothetical protein BV898_09541 [Hypsibius exemplaris]